MQPKDVHLNQPPLSLLSVIDHYSPSIERKPCRNERQKKESNISLPYKSYIPSRSSHCEFRQAVVVNLSSRSIVGAGLCVARQRGERWGCFDEWYFLGKFSAQARTCCPVPNFPRKYVPSSIQMGSRRCLFTSGERARAEFQQKMRGRPRPIRTYSR